MLSSFVALAVTLMPNDAWAAPPWANMPTRLVGRTLTTTCKGEGVSQAFARSAAIKSCQGFATEYLAEEVTVSKVSVETEKSAAFYQSVQSSSTVKNLNCKVQRESSEEQNGVYTSWVQCQFALDQAQTENVSSAPEVQNEKPKERYEPDVTLPAIETDGQRLVYIQTQPQCDSILIYSSSSRVVKCESARQTIVLRPDDTYFLLRKSGHMPVKVETLNIKDGEKIEKVLLPN